MVTTYIIIVLIIALFFSWRKEGVIVLKRLLGRLFSKKEINSIKALLFNKKATNTKCIISSPLLPPVLSKEQEERLKSAIRLTFTGDLILLKDMVENGYNSKMGRYSFDSMFKYVKEYYEEADYNLAVFEGPVAGEDYGYSSSCFDDGIPIYLNFPKEYAEAVKRAGFDMVSLSNNHFLDKGVSGAYHTLDVMDKIKLNHVGVYRNEKEKSLVRVVEVRGKRIVVLPYTYGSNHYKTDFFFQSENNHLTRLIVSPNSRYIKQVINAVKKDFEQARELSPDLIIVMPHMGKQFMHEPDEFQKFWCKVFVENGADIVLSDHPHAVQPIEWVKQANKNVLIVHCPGNFVNSYIAKDGDASMIVECYLDQETGRPFAFSCIPVYAYSKYGRSSVENYTGIPVYRLIKDESICPELSRYEFNRVLEVQKLVTKTALGVELGLDCLQNRYYSFADLGYVKQAIDTNDDVSESKEQVLSIN